MKKYTKILKNESKKDLESIYNLNNSKAKKRTEEQKEQSREDKKSYYLKKWNKLFEAAETKAQKKICENILNRLCLIR